MMKINKYFISAYLTPGETRDNFIFENCPLEFLEQAKDALIAAGLPARKLKK